MTGAQLLLCYLVNVEKGKSRILEYFCMALWSVMGRHFVMGCAMLK